MFSLRITRVLFHCLVIQTLKVNLNMETELTCSKPCLMGRIFDIAILDAA